MYYCIALISWDNNSGMKVLESELSMILPVAAGTWMCIKVHSQGPAVTAWIVDMKQGQLVYHLQSLRCLWPN